MPRFIYTGARSSNAGAGHVAVSIEGESRSTPLPPRHDVRNHSPDGFQWGYGGSGPAQLALALCIHALACERGITFAVAFPRSQELIDRASRVYQDFKFAVIARIETDVWTMTSDDVLAAISAIESGELRT